MTRVGRSFGKVVWGTNITGRDEGSYYPLVEATILFARDLLYRFTREFRNKTHNFMMISVSLILRYCTHIFSKRVRRSRMILLVCDSKPKLGMN